MSRPESPFEWMESEASSGCVWLTVTPLSSFSSWWQLVAIVWCWWSWKVCVWSGVWCQCNFAGERWSVYRTGGRGASESHLWNFLGIDALAGYRVSEHLIAVRFFVGWTFLYQFHKLLDAVLYSFSRILFNLFVIHLSRKIDFPMLFQKLGFWHCFANDLLPYKQSFYCSKITSRGAANRRSLDDIFPPTLYL